MKNILIIAIEMTLLTLNAAHAQPTTVTVNAAYTWTDTGIAVTNGEYINVNAAGFWNWSTYMNDPDGTLFSSNNTDVWLGNGLRGGLIAYIGSGPTNTYMTTNQYWQVGIAGQFVSPTNGELWLGINDTTRMDNGSNSSTISLQFDTNAIVNTNFVLNFAQITTNQFSFTVNGGIPNTVCAIYDSADLIHWTLDDSLVLDSTGSSTNGTDNVPPSYSSGLRSGIFINNTAVPYRFYKATCGQFWTHTIGFVTMTIPAYSTNAIANQLDASPDNTLSSVFAQSTLPAGVVVVKFNDLVTAGTNFTWSGSAWSGASTTTLAPGECGLFCNPTTNACVLTFVGTVREGTTTLTTSGTNCYTAWSSVLPLVGGIQSRLGFPTNPYNSVTGSGPLDNSYFDFWLPNNNQTEIIQFFSNPIYYSPGDYTGFYGPTSPVPEPIIRVGQSFLFYNYAVTNVIWTQTYSSYPLLHPPF